MVKPKDEFIMRWYHWLLIALLSAGLVFGIVQPFAWKLAFDEFPPSGAVTLSVLLTLFLALAGVGWTAFSYLAYRDLRHRLEESLEDKIATESKAALTRAVGTLAFITWRAWRKHRYDLDLIDGALGMQIRALERVKGLKPSDILPEDRILQAKSNVAEYTAFKKKYFPKKVSNQDIETARKMGLEAYERANEFGNKYDWKANYAMLLALVGTSDEKKLARKIKGELN